jgi:hypothetical protein
MKISFLLGCKIFKFVYSGSPFFVYQDANVLNYYTLIVRDFPEFKNKLMGVMVYF